MDRLRVVMGDSACRDEEQIALTHIVETHRQLHESIRSKKSHISQAQLYATMMEYRSALSQCVNTWEDQTDDNDDTFPYTALCLLKLNYAILHVCHVVVPLLPPKGVHWYENPYQTPGVASAAMVRCLRHNFIAEDKTDLLHLVLTGNLVQAWNVLSENQLFQASLSASDEDDTIRLRDLKREFLIVRELFLLAPLPGGRSIWSDDIPEDVMEEDQTIESDMLDRGVAEFKLNLDVRPEDYRLWDPHQVDPSDPMVHFDGIEVASTRHQEWQDCVRQVQGSLSLIRHVPILGEVFGILTGDTVPTSASWAEQLVADILYRQPTIRPDHMAARARSIWTETADELHAIPIVLDVLSGNVEKGLETLWVSGGGSGAALPGTLVALLYSLFADASIIRSSTEEQRAEYFCFAAESILSSLGDDRNDERTQLALRLLLPYALRGSAYAIRETIEVVVAHYTPSALYHAQAVLLDCQPLLNANSLQMLDACTSMLVGLYFDMMRQERPIDACNSLLEGMRIEKMLLQDDALAVGACHRCFCVQSLKSADLLLRYKAEIDYRNDSVEDVHTAALFGEAVTKLTVEHVDILPHVAEARLLVNVSGLAGKIETGDTNGARAFIETLLQDDRCPNSRTQVIRKIHWYVLTLAKKLIDSEDKDWRGFENKGMTQLMRSFVKARDCVSMQNEPLFTPEEEKAMGKSLANGLSQTFILENAKHNSKQTRPAMATPAKVQADKITTLTLKNYTKKEQEAYIERLLHHPLPR